MLGETLGQFVFEAGLAIAVLKIGGGAVAGQHMQCGSLAHPLQRAGRRRGWGVIAAGQQQWQAGTEQCRDDPWQGYREGRHARQYTQSAGLAIYG
ncbi:hypothetical protein GCM10007363_00720 [Pseudomonas fluvialis]|uniref:Uncharacterized protein n=1 Tax=Pseudomonas fluvialis TaxID=1793966 RepID=A0ABQ2ABZ7_9PSED|nr:hypothetical protein GCM10007363_00720 [Pseudomonas fluvialis]